MKYSAGIRSARQRAGISQDELARRSGRSQSSLSMFEAGRRRPSLAMIEVIAKGLGVSPLVIHLMSANGQDVPRGMQGILIVARIARLVDDLWRSPRNGSRNHSR